MLEILIEHVVDIDAGNAQKFIHVRLAEAPDIQTKFCETEQVTAVVHAKARRRPFVQAAKLPGEAVQASSVCNQRRLICFGHGSAGDAIAGNSQMIAIVSKCDGLQI